MAAISDFVKDLESEVPGCGHPAIKRAIIRGLREFCHRTLWWQETLATTVALADGTPTYTLTPPANAEIDIATKLWIAGVTDEIPLTSRAWLDANRPGWDASDATKQRVPAMWFSPGPGKITVHPRPNAQSVTDGLEFTARAALKPARTTDTIDDRFLDEAEDVVRSAALKRLLDTAQSWGNIRRAHEEEARFHAYVAEFKVEIAMGGGNGILTVQTGGFGGSVHRGNIGNPFDGWPDPNT